MNRPRFRQFVVAGNYRQYRRYLDRAGIRSSEADYVAGPDGLLGVKNPVVMLVGTYYQRTDWPAILGRLNAAGADLRYHDGD
jgi:hypothetical protein